MQPDALVQDGLRDIKGPVEYPLEWGMIVLIALGVIIFLAAAVYLIRKYRPVKKPYAPPPEPPWVTAFRRIKKLEEKNLPAEEAFDEFYTEISVILRHYIEARFTIKAPEMTTEEFLTSLDRFEKINVEQKILLREFLTFCDMVKFAKLTPDASEAHKALESVKAFVKETVIKTKTAVPSDNH